MIEAYKLMYVLEGVIIHCLFQYKTNKLSGSKFRITKGEQFFPSGVVKPWDSSPADVGVKSLHRLKWWLNKFAEGKSILGY